MFASSTFTLMLLGQLLAANTIPAPATSRPASEYASKSVAPAIAGRVVTEQGAPIPGVFVSLQGTPQATSTNASGSFLLSLTHAKSVLLFKCQGYRDLAVAAEASSSLVVKMYAVSRPTSGSTKDIAVASTAVAEPVVSASAATVLTYAEVMPAFPGGEGAYRKFISEHARFPEEALARGLSGTVFVSFVVDEEGRLTNAEVVRGSGHGFDEEALRLVRLMPWWTPGQTDGKPVRVAYTIRVPFVYKEG